MIYAFVFFLIFLANIHFSPDYSGNEIKKKRFICFASFLLFLLLMFRHDYVGSDTQIYRLVYENIDRYVRSDIFEHINIANEAGFYFLEKLLIDAGMPFEVLKFLSAALYMFALSFGIQKWSKMSWLSYVYFLCWGSFIFNCTMRHCFALSFFVFAVYYALTNKMVRYIAMALMALLFHASAITVIPTWLIAKVDLNKRIIALSLLLFLIVFVFADLILKIGVEITEKEYVNTGAGGFFTLIIHLLIIYFGLKRYRFMEECNKLFIMFNVICVVIIPVAMLNPALFRLQVYFNFFNVFLVPNIIKTYGYGIRKIIIPFIMFISIVNFVTTPSRSGVRVLPYVFYWENYLEINPNVPAAARV